MKTLMIIAIIAALAAVGGSVFVGVKSFDGTVTENPYEKGLQWDELRAKKTTLGWRIDIKKSEFRTGDNEIDIAVLDKYDEPLSAGAVTLMIRRPETSVHDRYFDTVQLKEGLFRSMVHFPIYGYWNVRVGVSLEGDSLSFDKRIFVEKGG